MYILYVAVTDKKYTCMCQLLTTSSHNYMCQLLTTSTIELASYWQQLHMYMLVTDN